MVLLLQGFYLQSAASRIMATMRAMRITPRVSIKIDWKGYKNYYCYDRFPQ